MCKFSIIIPALNAGTTIAETIESILLQDFRDWEAIIVDDGSTDATWQIAASFDDPRIRVIRNPGKGPSDARNFAALNVAKGEAIAFCDADDIWHRNKLARTHAVFQDPSVDAVYAQIGFFRETPSDCSVISTTRRAPLTIDDLLGENPVCTMSNLAIRTSSMRASGGFDRNLVHNEDLEWLVRLVGGGCRISGIAETLVWYRTNPNGLSADLAKMRVGRNAVLATAKRYGVVSKSRNEAIYARYLARRALRLDMPSSALRFSVEGVCRSPAGFFSPLNRGLLTAIGSVVSNVMPQRMRRHLFAR